MKFKEFYTQKKNISPRLEKILKENIAKAIEYSYKNVLTEGRWDPKGSSSRGGTIEDWSAELNLEDDEIKAALVDTLGGREEVADKAIESGDDAIDKLVHLLYKANKDGDEDGIEAYEVALKSMLMLSPSPKAEEIAKKYEKKLKDVEIEPGKAKKSESSKGGDDAAKADALAKDAADAKKEVESTETKIASSPEEKKTEKTLNELIKEWNKEVSEIEKNRKIGEALVEIKIINDKIIEASTRFKGVGSTAIVALLDRIAKTSQKFKKTLEKGTGGEDVMADKPEAKAPAKAPVKKPTKTPVKEPAKVETKDTAKPGGSSVESKEDTAARDRYDKAMAKKKEEERRKNPPTKEDERNDATIESVNNSSDKELLNEDWKDIITGKIADFFGANASQKAIAAEALLDEHEVAMSQALLNFYIKNPKSLLVAYEALGSISEPKLQKKMAEYMYYMFLMQQGKEKKWFKKDATDLLNKYTSGPIADGIAVAKARLVSEKIINP